MTSCVVLSWVVLLSVNPQSEPAKAALPIPPDRLFLSGRYDRIAPYSGGGGGASWLHSIDAGSLLEIGVYSNHLGSANWHYGRVGTVVVRKGRTLAGSLELGAGRELGEGFAYVVARGGYGWMMPGSIRAELAAEYFGVQRTRGFLAKGTIGYSPRSRFGLLFDYRHGLSPGLDVSQLGLRADAYPGRLHVLGGLSLGTFLQPELLVLGLDLGHQTELFGGLGVPLGEHELTVVFSRLSTDGMDRHSVSASLKWTLGDR